MLARAPKPRRTPTVSDPGQAYLPRASEAEIPDAKLRDYALNLQHAEGGHKARVFLSSLGFRQEDWPILREQILERVPSYPGTDVRPSPPWGIRYEVQLEITGRNGQTRWVVTGWLIATRVIPDGS